MASNVADKLKAALGYATFPSREIRELVNNVVNAHRNDLDDVGYEPSTTTEDAIKDLDGALNEYDERNTLDRETLTEAIKESKELPEEEEPSA